MPVRPLPGALGSIPTPRARISQEFYRASTAKSAKWAHHELLEKEKAQGVQAQESPAATQGHQATATWGFTQDPSHATVPPSGHVDPAGTHVGSAS